MRLVRHAALLYFGLLLDSTALSHTSTALWWLMLFTWTSLPHHELAVMCGLVDSVTEASGATTWLLCRLYMEHLFPLVLIRSLYLLLIGAKRLGQVVEPPFPTLAGRLVARACGLALLWWNEGRGNPNKLSIHS